MLDTLQKMSGTTHRTYTDQKTVTRDLERIWMKNEGKASYQMSTKEEPVIKYNDMAFISERNSMIFRAGDSPIWNRNETILPMSWRLFKNTIVVPGKDYTLQTIPTLSSAVDFDVRKNQPDFYKMLMKRMDQAVEAKDCMDLYQQVYGYTDYDISRLNPDDYSMDIMQLINNRLHGEDSFDPSTMSDEEIAEQERMQEEEEMRSFKSDITSDQDVLNELATRKQREDERNEKVYANGMLSKADLGTEMVLNHGFDQVFVNAFLDIKQDMFKSGDFTSDGNGSLLGRNGEMYIRKNSETEALRQLQEAGRDSENSHVYDENQKLTAEQMERMGSYTVQDAFLRYLMSLPNWKSIAGGKFDQAVYKQIDKGN